jgi:hypothetical protein
MFFQNYGSHSVVSRSFGRLDMIDKPWKKAWRRMDVHINRALH